MKFTFSILIVWVLALQVKSQSVASSVFIEYGYPNIPEDSVVLHMMYGMTKYRAYADEHFLVIESFQDLPEEQRKIMGNGLQSMFIKERRTDDLFLCVTLDSLRLRMKGREKELASFQKLIETYNSVNAPIFGKGLRSLDIAGHASREFLIKGSFTDTISAYLADQIILADNIKDFPMQVANEEGEYGVLLGRDEVLWNGSLIEFRATNVEINKPKDIASELQSFELCSKEEGEKKIKAYFMKLMGMPQGDGKN